MSLSRSQPATRTMSARPVGRRGQPAGTGVDEHLGSGLGQQRLRGGQVVGVRDGTLSGRGDVESGHARGAAWAAASPLSAPLWSCRRRWAEQPEHRARRHGEAHAVDRWSVEGGAAEPLHQVDGFDGW